jgi:hypothetical protein
LEPGQDDTKGNQRTGFRVPGDRGNVDLGDGGSCANLWPAGCRYLVDCMADPKKDKGNSKGLSFMKLEAAT